MPTGAHINGFFVLSLPFLAPETEEGKRKEGLCQGKLNLFPASSTGADIQYVNMKNLTGGIVHTKFWVVDQKHVYIGSANMDWRSLTQVPPGRGGLNVGVRDGSGEALCRRGGWLE